MTFFEMQFPIEFPKAILKKVNSPLHFQPAIKLMRVQGLQLGLGFKWAVMQESQVFLTFFKTQFPTEFPKATLDKAPASSRPFALR